MPTTREQIPVRSQIQDRESRSSHAHRRARMDPMPSHTKATAMTPYMAEAAHAERRSTPPPADSERATERKVKGTSKAQERPMRTLTAPKMIRPRVRSLNSAVASLEPVISTEDIDGRKGRSRRDTPDHPSTRMQVAGYRATHPTSCNLYPGGRKVGGTLYPGGPSPAQPEARQGGWR
jgi:hypothetical protein